MSERRLSIVKLLTVAALAALLAAAGGGCFATAPPRPPATVEPAHEVQPEPEPEPEPAAVCDPDRLHQILSEQEPPPEPEPEPEPEPPTASTPGLRVLETGQRMVDAGVVVKGSCWGYANAVYTRAGYPHKRGKRKTIFKGKKKRGKRAPVKLFQPGDWLYYINHSYGGCTHSAIFVRWVDKRRKLGLMLTYVGAGRDRAGDYREYDLRDVYRVIRPAD